MEDKQLAMLILFVPFTIVYALVIEMFWNYVISLVFCIGEISFLQSYLISLFLIVSHVISSYFQRFIHD